MSWVCEYQHTRHSYLKQCLQSLRIPNKSFKVGSGEKCFELVDLTLYNDYDRIFSLKPKDGADESNPKPSLDVGRMLLHFMPQDLQDEYKEIFNEHTKQKGVDPITHSYHQASSGQPFKQALKAFAKMHIIAHPEDASSDVQLRDVDKGVCMVIDDIILDIKENKNKFLKAKREGDTDEDWMYSMNRVFRPLEHFFQGLIYRYRVFHSPEEASGWVKQFVGCRVIQYYSIVGWKTAAWTSRQSLGPASPSALAVSGKGGGRLSSVQPER